MVALRLIDVNDVSDQYVRWLNDKDLVAYLDLRHRKTSHAQALEFVHHMNSSPSDLLLGIFNESSALLGSIRLGPIDFPNLSAEMGLLIGDRKWHGRGLARSVLRATCHAAHTHLGLVKFTAGIIAENEPSIRAFKAAGFRLEGRQLSQEILLSGIRTDVLQFGRIYGEVGSGEPPVSGSIIVEWPRNKMWDQHMRHYKARLSVPESATSRLFESQEFAFLELEGTNAGSDKSYERKERSN